MHLIASVTSMWKPTCSLRLFSRENGFSFSDLAQRKSVKKFCNRTLVIQWEIDNSKLMVRRYRFGKRSVIKSTCVDPFLHLTLWSNSIFSKLASLVGFHC